MANSVKIPLKTARELMSSNGSLILLWVLKHHGPVNFSELYELVTGNVFIKSEPHYGVAIRAQDDMMAIAIEGLLKQLVDLGLVELQESDPDDIRYSASSNIEKVLRIFQLMSLDEQVLVKVEGHIVVRPTFGPPQTASNEDQLLAILPPLKTSEENYVNSIKRVAYNLNIKCKRTQDLYSNNSLLNKNWSSLFRAQICIADCTGRDSNVFYSLGIAHTIGKKCILISQSLDDIPVDLRQSPIIIYDHSSAGLDLFQQALSDLLTNEFTLLSR